MENQELVSYIASSRASGVTDENIQNTLRQAGWTEDVIRSSFEFAKNSTSANASSFLGTGTINNTAGTVLNDSGTSKIRIKPILIGSMLFLILGTTSVGAYFLIEENSRVALDEIVQENTVSQVTLETDTSTNAALQSATTTATTTLATPKPPPSIPTLIPSGKVAHNIRWKFPVVLFETSNFEVIDDGGIKSISFSAGENQGISFMPMPPGAPLIPGKDTIKIRGPVSSDLNHVNGKVVFLSGSFSDSLSIVAVDAKKGTKAWSKTGNYRALATTDSDLIAVDATEVYSLNAADGSERWKYPLANVTFKPVIANNTVYLGTKDKFLYGLDLKSGKEKFKITYNDVGLIAKNDDSDLYVCGALSLQRINLQTQKILWSKGVRYDKDYKRDVGCSSFLSAPSMALDGRSIYLITEMGGLVSFDKETGSKILDLLPKSGSNDPGSWPSLGITDNMIYAGSGTALQGVDKKNGSTLWSVPINAPPTDSVVRNGIIYFGTWAGDFYAYDISTKKKVFENIIKKETGINKPMEYGPLLVGSTLYFGGKEGVLYALEIK